MNRKNGWVGVGALVFAIATIVIWLVALTMLSGCASFDASRLGGLLGGGGLDESTITAGLREALEVGTGRAVATVSVRDGYLGDPDRRIPLPVELQSAAGKARQLGFGAQVDEFETAMNRAAEAAAGEALDVFAGVLRTMTWQDARGILEGGDDAATAFFRRRTEDELAARFRPIVEDKMGEVGLVNAWNRVQDAWKLLPLGDKPDLDLAGYVTGRALDGLFGELAAEERRIREDPAARSTELLRKVFGA
jgi:hypothetical protein